MIPWGTLGNVGSMGAGGGGGREGGGFGSLDEHSVAALPASFLKGGLSGIEIPMSLFGRI